MKVNGYLFRENISAIFIFAALSIQGQSFKEKSNLPLSKYFLSWADPISRLQLILNFKIPWFFPGFPLTFYSFPYRFRGSKS